MGGGEQLSASKIISCLTIQRPCHVYHTYRAVEAFWPITKSTGQWRSRSVSSGSPRFPSTVKTGNPRHTTAVTGSNKATYKHITFSRVVVHQKTSPTTWSIHINMERKHLTLLLSWLEEMNSGEKSSESWMNCVIHKQMEFCNFCTKNKRVRTHM